MKKKPLSYFTLSGKGIPDTCTWLSIFMGRFLLNSAEVEQNLCKQKKNWCKVNFFLLFFFSYYFDGSSFSISGKVQIYTIVFRASFDVVCVVLLDIINFSFYPLPHINIYGMQHMTESLILFVREYWQQIWAITGTEAKRFLSLFSCEMMNHLVSIGEIVKRWFWPLVNFGLKNTLCTAFYIWQE